MPDRQAALEKTRAQKGDVAKASWALGYLIFPSAMLELGVCIDMPGGDSEFKPDPVCALRTMRKGFTF